MSLDQQAAVPDLDAITARLRAAGCVFAEDEARLLVQATPTPAALRDLVSARIAGQPLEHLVGWVDFCGLRVPVDPGVFVPRRRTELLVRRAAAFAPAGATLVDLACGCGAIGLAVASLVAGVRLHAVEIEPAAVACARRNLTGIGTVYAGDLFAPLPQELRGTVDVLAANVPYVPSAAIGLLPREARDYEPLVTLDGGADGLDVLRRVAAGAPGWLAPGGHLLLEVADDQAEAALGALADAGLAATLATDDNLGATVVIGRAGNG